MGPFIKGEGVILGLNLYGNVNDVIYLKFAFERVAQRGPSSMQILPSFWRRSCHGLTTSRVVSALKYLLVFSSLVKHIF